MRAFYWKLAARPVQNMLIFMAVNALLWTFQCLFFQNMVPTDTKEAVSWGAQLDMGYYKHPPLAAHIAYLVFRASGWHDWSLYLLAQISIITGVYFIYRLAAEFTDRRRAVTAALALYFLYYYNPSTMNFNPNFADMALLPCVTFIFYRALRQPSWWRWMLLGLTAGLAVMGKYSAGIILLTLAVLMLCRREYRGRLFSYGPYLALAVFAAVVAPHIDWLIKHDFISLTYIGESVNRNKKTIVDFLGIAGQAVYPFAMTAGVIFLASMPRKRWRRELPVIKEGVLWGGMLGLVPGILFIFIAAAGGNVIATWFNSLSAWASIAVVSFWPWHISRKTFRKFLLLLCIYTAIVFIAVTCDAGLKARDRLHLSADVLQEKVEKYWSSHSALPIACVIGEGEIAYALECYLPYHPVSAEVEDMVSMKKLRGLLQEKGGLLIVRHADEAEVFVSQECRPELKIKLETLPVPYRARWSREKVYSYTVAFIPPGALR